MAEPIDWPSVGARIKRLRLEKGLTQRALAEPKYTSTFISLIESGDRGASRVSLEHIAHQLEVEVDELLSGRSKRMEADLLLTLYDARRALHSNDLDRADSSTKSVVTKARRHGYVRVEAKALEQLGHVLERRGELEAALARYEEAERRWNSEPLHLRYDAVCGVARCNQLLGNPRIAIHILESFVLDLAADEIDDPTALMRTHSSLVAAYFATGLPELASKSAARALELQQRVEDVEQIACMNVNVARALLRQGQPGDALEAMRTAERIYAGLEWAHDVAQAKIAQGIILAEKDELEDSHAVLSEAVDLLKGSPNALDYVRAVNELARVDRLLGRPKEAAELLESITDQLADSDLLEQGAWHRELALCVEGDDPKRAEELLRSAAHFYRTADAPAEVASTYRHLAEFFERQGDIQQSLSAYREAVGAIEERKT